MTHGFDFACDSLKLGDRWLTHHPATTLPEGCTINIHGHLHNPWGKPQLPENQKDFVVANKLWNPWQRLFSIEYTDYYPIEIEEFLNHPKKYQSTGPTKEALVVGP
jgi:hypothetical protein